MERKTFNVIKYNYFFKCQVTMSREYMIDGENIVGKCGIYKLFNENKEMVYIGKSTTDLFKRIIGSSYERKNAIYYSYAITRTKSDVGIYEMYYIGNLKPLTNKDGKFEDYPTMILEELIFSEIRPLYRKATDEEVERVDRLMKKPRGGR